MGMGPPVEIQLRGLVRTILGTVWSGHNGENKTLGPNNKWKKPPSRWQCLQCGTCSVLEF